MPAHQQFSDEEMLRHYRATGDAQILGTLLQRHTLLLLGVALKYLKNRDAAEDAVQAVFLKALTHLPQGEVQNFKGWLYILTRNHCLQSLRDKTRLAPDEALQSVAAAEDEKEAHLLKEITLTRMLEALQQIPEEQQQCLRRFFLQKQSYGQIQEATGYTFAQVKSYIQNGKRNLKILLLKAAS